MDVFSNVFYMYSKMNSSSQILLFLIILVGLMLVSISVINHITKKRNEKYDMKFNPINRYASAMENKKREKPKKLTIEKIEKEDVKEEKIEEKFEEIKEEIETLEEPEIVEIVSSDNSIDKISELLEDGINNKMDPINLTRFEEEQEKNAIISYDELVKRAGAKKIVYKTEKATINEEVKEEKIQIKSEENKSKFKASAVISPIYGIQKNKKQDEFIEVDNVGLNKRKTDDEEIKNDVDFLNSLKSFRKEL